MNKANLKNFIDYDLPDANEYIYTCGDRSEGCEATPWLSNFDPPSLVEFYLELDLSRFYQKAGPK